MTLEKEPEAFGYEFAIWTVARLRDHLVAVKSAAIEKQLAAQNNPDYAERFTFS